MRLLRRILLITTISQSIIFASPYWKHQELQGNVGSCHTFATISLIEAEYWRATGNYINLSERDLFIRHFMGSQKNPPELLSAHLNKALQGKVSDNYLEAGHISDDFKLATTFGISSEKELPYRPMLKTSVSLCVERLRHERNNLSSSSEALRSINALTKAEGSELITKHFTKLNNASMRAMFTPPKATRTSKTIQTWLSNYSLKTLTPKTTKSAKSTIISKVASQPIAVDITNFNELTAGKVTNALHNKHSLVVFAYNAKNDTFSVRSSTHNKPIQVSANALSRGAYRLYYLVRK